MPLYEYDCYNPDCIKRSKKPFEFDASQPLSKAKERAECPKCGYKKHVKKVIRSAFPRSATWRV